MKIKFLSVGILIGILLLPVSAKAANQSVSTEGESAKNMKASVVTIQDIMELNLETKEKLVEFCKGHGLILNEMKQGKLNYSFQIPLYASLCMVCVHIEEEIVTEIYIKPSDAKLSGWVHRFNECFGECIEIEKVSSETKQQMQYMTWMDKQHYISIVRMNKNMYIYITGCD